MDQNLVKPICPKPIGWLEYTLNQEEIDFLWRMIEDKKGSWKSHLIGHVSGSYALEDDNNWFFETVCLPLINRYIDEFKNMGKQTPITGYAPYHLDQWWVNFQQQTEFNPVHTHSGVYSFVIWMKIPTTHAEQNENPIAKDSNHGGTPRISTFEFVYTDILGSISNYTYVLNEDDPVKMLIFPSKLPHLVYPYYDCADDRITIAGNIGLLTRPWS
tara:strand:+ start:135 stop:779 length:645 start_codon:yes stop_codon:yes gene_type:complete